jgi:hypothetical protein
VADFQITSNSGRQWASGNIKQLNGQRGLGFYRLMFILVLNVDSHDAVLGERLTGLVADVMTAGQPVGRAGPRPNELPLLPYNFAQERQMTLELELDRARLEALENIRNGKELTFNLNIYTTLLDSTGQPRQVSVSAGHTQNQSGWIAILEQMGYGKTMLIEVPVPDGQQFAELAAAVALLARAQESMARGEYREAVGLCRDVMDRINSALKDNDDLSEFANLREKTKADRVRLLRRALRVFTHPARHADDASSVFEWTRIDASSAISIVSALLNELAAPGAR